MAPCRLPIAGVAVAVVCAPPHAAVAHEVAPVGGGPVLVPPYPGCPTHPAEPDRARR
jgi:hypothetical protein